MKTKASSARSAAIAGKSAVLTSTRLAAAVIAGVLSVTAHAAPPVRVWASHLGGAGEDRLEAACYAPDGSLLVAGNTLTTGNIGGIAPVQLGSDRDAGQQTGFIARLAADGSSVLGVTKFGHGAVYLTDVAADGDSIYAAGYATADFRPQLAADAYDRTDLSTAQVWAMATDTTGSWKSNVYRSVLIRLNAQATQVLDATYLGEAHPRHPDWGIGDYWDPAWAGRNTDPIGNGGAGSGMWKYVRGQNLIRRFANGDLLVAADCGLRWSAGVDAIYRFRRDDFSAPVWKRVVNPEGNNSDLIDGSYTSNVCGFTRINGIAIVPGSEEIYVSGTGNGDTGFEPYYDPFVFKYDSAGNPLWPRSGVTGGGASGTFDRLQGDVRPNQADALGEGIAAASDGRAFVAMWTDGGNTWLGQHPWDFGAVTNQDGDTFSSFNGRAQVSVSGILNGDGVSGWARSNRLKPYGYDAETKRYTNVFYDIAPVLGGTGTKAYLAGSSHNALSIAAWDDSTAAGYTRLGVIAGFDYAAGGTTREFVTHLRDVSELRRIAGTWGGRRFAAVGYSFGDNAPVPSGFQTARAGGDDGYIVVFEEPVAPAAPTATSATSLDALGFTANWNAAGGATGYRLDLSNTADFSSYLPGYQDFAVGTATSLAVTVSVAEPLYYRVRAVNAYGTSASSNTITVPLGIYQFSVAEPSQLTPQDPAWETDYLERVSAMVNAKAAWTINSGNGDTDSGKYSWSPLLAEMWKDRANNTDLNTWITGTGGNLINSTFAGSFYKAFSCPGYNGYYFRFKDYNAGVALPATQLTAALNMIGTDAAGNPDNSSLRKGWAYMARPDHHMDPIYTFTEFNSENFHWMERCAAVQWAYESADADLGSGYYGNSVGNARAWASGWLDNLTRGLVAAGRCEWNSNNYWNYNFSALSTLYDLPPGSLPVPGMNDTQRAALADRVKNQARACADWMVLENALHYLDGFRGGPDCRAKGDAQNAFAGDTWSWLYAHFAGDEGSAEHPTYSRATVQTKMPQTTVGFIAWADYRPLQVLLDIAHRRFAMPVEIQSAKPHYSFDESGYAGWDGGAAWNPHASMTKYGARFEFETIYLDENCLLASAATFRPDAAAMMTSQSNFFSEQNLWRIMAKGTDNGALQVAGNTLADPGSYVVAGRDPWENIGQHGNVMILALKRPDSNNGEFMVVPQQATREMDGDRLFCDLGNGVYFVAIPWCAGTIATANSTHSTTHQKYQWTFPSGQFGAVVVELGVARDHGSYAAFKAAVLAGLSTRLTSPAADTVQYVSTLGETTRLAWQKPWNGQAGEPVYTLADGTVWGDSGSEAAGVVPRLWRDGGEVDYSTWDAYRVVRGEEIVRQEWGGDRLLMMAGGNGAEIRVDPATAEVSYYLAAPATGAAPTDNPVAAAYGPAAYPWTDEIPWDRVFDVTDYPGADDTARYNAARDAAAAAGGGVVYFPAGTYTFSGDLYLKDGVVIRGADPTGITDATVAGYAPPTRFEFPAYVPSLSGSGADNSAAFKKITTTTPATDSNIGIVNVDVNRAAISFPGGVSGSNRNIVLHGVRSNNVAEPDSGVPASWQQQWQRWSYRFAANIRVQAYANVLVANCRLNDAVTDNFEQPGYVVSSTGAAGGTLTTLTTGSQALFNYTNHYGIVVNRDGNSSGLSVAPLSSPSLFRPGIVIRDNHVFHTMRVAIHAAGQGLVIKDNVVRDQNGKTAYVDPTGKKPVSNSATLENRIIDWSGWNVAVEGNDGEVFRHVLNGGTYMSVDGEAILAQECCGGTLVNGVAIRDNTVNSYIGLYKMQDIRNVDISNNTVSGSDLGIYVNANTNSTSYAARDVSVSNNSVTDGPIILTAATGVTNCTITNNTGNNAAKSKITRTDGVSISGNTGFTIDTPATYTTANRKPLVTLSSSVTGDVIEGTDIVLDATASDPDGTVSSVEFYINGTLYDTLAAAPYGITLPAPAIGDYMLVAKAIDNSGASYQSWPVYVRVRSASALGNPPTVAITSPAANAILPSASVVNLTASASDTDGTVSLVEFYVDAAKVGEDATAPYACDWTAPDSTGSRTLTARATDNDGRTAWSAPVTVTLQDLNAPTIATAASASPATVTGTSTSLSVLGADANDGEAALVYTWSATVKPSGATVSFSPNGSNAAKATTATFSAPGAYTLTVTVADPGGKSVQSSVNVTVVSTPQSLAVTPASVLVQRNATQAFAASGSDQFGNAIPAGSISWSVSGGGSISSTGVFTAGATSGGPHTVTATAAPASGTAQVTVVDVDPNSPTVATPPAAAQNPVTGVSTTVSVLGADANESESMLTYTWSAVTVPSGAAVSFSPNGTNAAKNATATFNAPGAYTLRVTIADSSGKSVTADLALSVSNTVVSLTVSPASANLAPGATQQFTASATNQFGGAVGTSTATWSVSGGGSISTSGLFTAGSTPGGPHTVTAAFSGLEATASVTVVAPELELPRTSLTQNLVAGGTTTAPLHIRNTGNSNLTWSATVSGSVGTPGTYSASNSSQPGGPSYSWIDISSDGTVLMKPATNEVMVKNFSQLTFPSGFTFPFYGSNFTAARVDSYGFITFDTGSSSSGSTNMALPTSDSTVPVNIIAALWREWRLDKDSWVKWKRTATDTLVITWFNAYANNDKTKRSTYQLVLKTSGEILVQVKSHLATDRIYTSGIMNGTRSAGVTATHNPATDFVPVGAASNFAIRYAQGFNFLTMSPLSGTVAGGTTAAPTLSFSAAGLTAGNSYNGSVTLATNDSDEASVVFPVTLVVTAAAQPPNAPVALEASATGTSTASLTWLDGGAGTTGYLIQLKTGGGTFADLATISSSTTTHTATGLAAGATHTFRVRATNAAGASAWSNEAVVTTEHDFDSWIAIQAGVGALTAASDDPDADGIPNLVEYALGGEPGNAASRNAPQQGMDGSGHLTLTFTPDVVSGLAYVIEASPDLSDWSEQTDITSLLTPGTPHTHTDTAAPGAGRFLRLKVISN